MSKPYKEVGLLIVNKLLNEIDGIFVAAWSFWKHKGMTKTEFMKIKRAIKKRL